MYTPAARDDTGVVQVGVGGGGATVIVYEALATAEFVSPDAVAIALMVIDTPTEIDRT
jgi:hypothetical protein